MGKKEHLKEINEQIDTQLRSMFGTFIGAICGMVFFVIGIYFKTKVLGTSEFNWREFMLDPSIFGIIMYLGIAFMVISAVLYFKHNKQYVNLKLEAARLR